MVAPVFNPDTADAATWTLGEEIAPIILPYPDNAGGITPTRPIAYAAQGALPAGIMLEGYQDSVNIGGSTEQTFNFASTAFRRSVASVGYLPSASSRPELSSGFTPAGQSNRNLIQIFFLNDGRVQLNVGIGQSDANADLTDNFELHGSITLTVGSNSITVALAGADTAEPYSWAPANSAEVIAFYNAVTARAAGTLVLRDFTVTQRNRARIIGTPTRGGSGNIVIRATNSAGNDDWTLPYAISGFFGAWGRQKIQAGAWGRTKFSGGIGAIGGMKLR